MELFRLHSQCLVEQTCLTLQWKLPALQCRADPAPQKNWTEGSPSHPLRPDLVSAPRDLPVLGSLSAVLSDNCPGCRFSLSSQSALLLPALSTPWPHPGWHKHEGGGLSGIRLSEPIAMAPPGPRKGGNGLEPEGLHSAPPSWRGTGRGRDTLKVTQGWDGARAGTLVSCPQPRA